MNNKKIFSVKMFWQSFLQLKVIGFISTILMVLITCVPICISAVNIKSNIEYAGVEKASRYVQLVDGNDFIPILILTFAIITPVLVLFAWNFLNKRNTSDFYHSLAYTRLNLYLTKIAAFVLWILIMYASIFLSAAILYNIFKTCYIVNYGSILSVFFSEFICCLLCAAAATLACSITGNIFSNICLTGLILFFPRFIILMVQVTVVSIVYFASSEHFVSILDNSYNMIVGQVFSVFTGSSLDGVINVAHSKIYTFVLALIYFVTGCLLFIRRKSETAGKPTLSWKLQFVIRTVIGFSISIIGVISFVGAVRNADIEKSQSILYVVITFIVAAVVVIVYELIASRKTHRVIKAIPSIITAYVLAAVFGVIVNIGIGSMINYQPDASKIKYIKINTGNGSYVYDKDYFSDVFSQVKIDDIDAINSIVNSMKDNMEIYNTSDEYSAIFQNGDYSPVTVYIKDGIWGRYRTVYVKEKDIQTIINGAVKNDEFCKKYVYQPTVDAMAAEGRPFKGIIFFGLMLTADGPKVLEYNARFGDPEAQVVLPRMKNDIIEVMEACVNGTLDQVDLQFEDNAAVCVVLASDGYPVKYEKGIPMYGFENFKDKDGYYCFHAGTKLKDGQIVTNGGRVLGITATGKDLKEARKNAYEATEWITFANKYMRHDIGKAIDEA